jgi:hypothetical protein
MTDEPSEDERVEPTYLQSDEAEAGHKKMALSELRKQGCSCRAISYSQYYDSYFCETCNIWAEPACSDERCHYCRQRPAVPSLARH